MTYRKTSKARKVWSEQAHAKKEKLRLASAPECCIEPEIDRTILITIERPGLNEKAEFQLLEGTQINNYSVYCNGKSLGVMGITKVMEGIRKALPAFRRMD